MATAFPAPEPSTILVSAEFAAQARDYGKALRLLQQLPLDEFGDLLLDVPDIYPALRQLLPEMPSDDVQRNWTGTCGKPLQILVCDFVRSLEKACQQYLGHTIQGRVLDYGCGWGRIIRLILRYVEPNQIYGLDPWDASIALCRQHKCPGHLAVCDYVPKSLPLTGKFDIIYSFSVFTHLSEKTAHAVMRVLRTFVATDGLLAITIRPPEYWDVHQEWCKGYDRTTLRQQHDTKGYAFMPHYRDPIDGDITYGDTSMTLDYIRQQWPQWRMVGTDLNSSDPWQTIVYMKPA